MPGDVSSYCRLCEGLCGVELHLEGDRIADLQGDGANPTNAGYACDAGRASTATPGDPQRITQPMKRDGDRLTPISWETAISEIGGKLGAMRRSHGPRSVGLYAGGEMARNHLGALRTAAFALGLGTPNLFTPLAASGASLIYASELMIGYPVPLQADVGRTHYTILMGGVDPSTHRWGPLQHGTVHTEAQAYFRRSRKTRLVAVDPRTTADSQAATQHLRIRPGTEVFYLLGLSHLFLSRGWVDEQYLDDYVSGLDELAGWLAPWTPERVASICGIQAADVSGVALKFSQAAMATITHGPFLFRTQNASAAAWAWLVAHALTANLLRPGGAYEARGLVDLQPLVASLPTAQAPRGAASDLPALLLQLPHTALAQEIAGPDKTRVRGLICLGGDPLDDLPQPGALGDALGGLDLLVCLSAFPGPAHARADYVLPVSHFWEREDLQLLGHALLPTRFIQATPAALPPAGEARTEDRILADLFRAANPPLLGGGAWGRHLQLMGRYAATGDLNAWVDQGLDLAGLPSTAELQSMPHGLDRGELDRAQWRVTHPDRRLDMTPAALADTILNLKPRAADPRRPFRLVAVDPAVGETGEGTPIRVSAETGVSDGDAVRLQTPFGEHRGVARVDPGLHPEAVLVTWGPGVGELFSDTERDPLTGAPDLTGVPCSVKAI